jgi:hypothetical protein
MSLSSLVIKFSATILTLNSTIVSDIIKGLLFIGIKLATFGFFHHGSKLFTFCFPFGFSCKCFIIIILFSRGLGSSFRVFFILFFENLDMFSINNSVCLRIKFFSFLLKYFSTNIFVFFNSVFIKFTTTPFSTL